MGAGAPVEPARRRLRSVRRAAGRVRAGRRRSARARFQARRRGPKGRATDADANTLLQRFPRRRPPRADALEEVAALLAAHARRRAGRHARSGARTCWRTAGSSTRRWPAGCGRAAATTSPAARSAFAISCRTPWRSCTPSRSCCASSSCCARASSSSKATSSTGGIRRRAAACARAAPTICLWLPLATARYVAATGDTGVLDETRALPRRPRGQRRRRLVLRSAAPLRRRPRRSTSTACARSRKALRVRVARPAAHGHRRLERRHEPRRRGRARAKACGSRSSSTTCSMRFARRRARAMATPLSPSAADAKPRGCGRTSRRTRWDGEWYRRAYFDDGTPLGSQRDPECSIDSISQSWSVLSGAARPRARARRRWTRSTTRLVRREDRLIQLLDSAVRQVGAESRLHQRLRAGRAGERRAVHARRDLGGDGVRRARRQRARVGALRAHQSDQSRATAPQATAIYKVEPYVVAADVYAVAAARRARRLDLVHRLRRLDVPADRRIAAGAEARSERLRFAPCLPAAWESVKIDYRYRETTLSHRDRPAAAAQPAAMTITLDGIMQPDARFPSSTTASSTRSAYRCRRQCCVRRRPTRRCRKT